MQSDLIPFGIEEDGHKSDLLGDPGFGHYDFPADIFYPAEDRAKVFPAVQVRDRAFGRRLIALPVTHCAPNASVGRMEESHLVAQNCIGSHFGSKDSAVEFFGPVKICRSTLYPAVARDQELSQSTHSAKPA